MKSSSTKTLSVSSFVETSPTPLVSSEVSAVSTPVATTGASLTGVTSTVIVAKALEADPSLTV